MDAPAHHRAPATSADELKVAVAVATIGRPEVVRATVERLLTTQTLAPSQVVISCVSAEDSGGLEELPGVELVLGPKGLPAQRNTALNHLRADTDIVVFFDDDFVADADWLRSAARVFAENADVVAFTGDVLVDDIKGPGLSFEEAVRIVDEHSQVNTAPLREPFSPYGCNMAFRMSAIGDHRFDEKLVLYGWLEDRDFAAALVRKGGRSVKCADARGVHMGVKSGRIAGDRLGYSQIINPFYMLKKGTMTPGQVADHVFRNVTSNIVRAPYPEPFIDRWGRLKGNCRGFVDLLRGELRPDRAAEIGVKPHPAPQDGATRRG